MAKQIAFCELLIVVLATSGSSAEEICKDPLADYVAKNDKSYLWVEIDEGQLGEGSYAELILTSQTWRDIVWKHQLFIFKPSTVKADTTHALLFISGGDWRDELENPSENKGLPRDVTLFAAYAEQMKTPVAVLLHVPHQPIFGGKREDEIIALTFQEYLQTRDPQRLVLLPMVKSAVRAMDAVQEFAQQRWSMKIKTFTVSGASKRGWTTWLTGAIDKRVTAIVPMVIDVLNMRPPFKRQFEAWNKPSEMLKDYTQRELHKRLKTDAGEALLAIVDPYSYRRRLIQPKLIIIGTNDGYWPLDSLNLYWKELSGQKHILYLPGSRHARRDIPRVLGTLTALHQSVAFGTRLPKLTWKFTRKEERLSLRVESDLRPTKVRVWLAKSLTRDFRKAKWQSFPMRFDCGGFTYDLKIAQKGYVAMFGEATYDNGGLPYFLSTNVMITDGENKSCSSQMQRDNGSNRFSRLSH